MTATSGSLEGRGVTWLRNLCRIGSPEERRSALLRAFPQRQLCTHHVKRPKGYDVPPPDIEEGQRRVSLRPERQKRCTRNCIGPPLLGSLPQVLAGGKAFSGNAGRRGRGRYRGPGGGTGDTQCPATGIGGHTSVVRPVCPRRVPVVPSLCGLRCYCRVSDHCQVNGGPAWHALPCRCAAVPRPMRCGRRSAHPCALPGPRSGPPCVCGALPRRPPPQVTLAFAHMLMQQDWVRKHYYVTEVCIRPLPFRRTPLLTKPTFGPTEGRNVRWREASGRRQRQTNLVPTPPPPLPFPPTRLCTGVSGDRSPAVQARGKSANIVRPPKPPLSPAPPRSPVVL